MKKASRYFAIFYLSISFFLMLLNDFLKLDPYSQDLEKAFEKPSVEHILGRDDFGRDLFARIINANKNSLSVAILSSFIALILGSFSAILSSFLSSKIDRFISSLNDILLSIPTILIAISFYFAFNTRFFSLILSIGLVLSPLIFKVSRAEIKNIKNSNYIKASLILGSSKSKIFFWHIILELLISLSIQIGFLLSQSIIIESSLSFLGLGIEEPEASLGMMLSKSQLLLTCARIPIIAGFFLTLLILCINITADFISSIFNENKELN